MKDDDDTMCYRSELEAAVRAEREACAKVCYDMFDKTGLWAALRLSDEIRARGQDPMPLFDDWDKDWAK